MHGAPIINLLAIVGAGGISRIYIHGDSVVVAGMKAQAEDPVLQKQGCWL